jgi:hypothetical protein
MHKEMQKKNPFGPLLQSTIYGYWHIIKIEVGKNINSFRQSSHQKIK